MTWHDLPWQDLAAWLIGLGAVAYLARRWWPGRRHADRQSACQGQASPAKTVSCQGACSGCAATSRPHPSKGG